MWACLKGLKLVPVTGVLTVGGVVENRYVWGGVSFMRIAEFNDRKI